MVMRKITPVGRPIGRTKPGHTMQMSAAQASALVAIDRVRYVLPEPAPPPVPEAVPEPEMEPEAESKTEVEPDKMEEAEEESETGDDEEEVRISLRTGKPVRRYSRRDMTAEE